MLATAAWSMANLFPSGNTCYQVVFIMCFQMHYFKNAFFFSLSSEGDVNSVIKARVVCLSETDLANVPNLFF